MALVPIDQLASGMVLSDDVRDATARLLLSKGLCIEARHIRLLKMWGVFEVQVQGPDPVPQAPPASADPERLEAVEGAVNRLFINLDREHPAVQEILRLSVAHRMTRGAGPTDSSGPGGVKPGETNAPAANPLAALERLDIQLPEVPSLVFELNEIIADPLSSAADIADLVQHSPSLTAMLLKIVNSAFYGFRSKIDTISRAVVVIGSKEVSNLALGITIMERFKDIPAELLDVASFMLHSLACGVVARILAAHGHLAATEQLFVSGMLHDIGRLVLCKYFPEIARSALINARHSEQSLLKAELDTAGCTHTRIGRALIQKWKLPCVLESNVHYHHNPSGAPQPESAAAVQAADIIVHGLGIGASGEHVLPGFDIAAWERMHLPAGALASIFHQAVHQIENLRHALC